MSPFSPLLWDDASRGVARRPLELHDLIHEIAGRLCATGRMICTRGGYGAHKGGWDNGTEVFDKFLATADYFSTRTCYES